MEELTDVSYQLISHNKTIMIVSDELSVARGKRVLELTLAVEVQLKKLMIYVYPKIISILGAENLQKSNIEICKMLSLLAFGDLTKNLAVDLSLNEQKIFRSRW